MEILHSIILGVIQGLTEFLPVSSSGHISIFNSILETNLNSEDYVLMNVVLHAATASSIIYTFRKDLYGIILGLFKNEKQQIDFSIKIILSMIPAVLVGLLLEKKIKSLFSGENKFLIEMIGVNHILYLVGAMLLITACLLLLADKARPNKKNITILGSIVIGVAQAIAILPGISRSGATIATSVLLGSDKEKSARFSFLMSVPLIIGIMCKEIYSIMTSETSQSYANYTGLLIGFFTAFIIGIFACKWMINLVKNSQLKYFSYYCIIIGSSIIIFQYISNA